MKNTRLRGAFNGYFVDVNTTLSCIHAPAANGDHAGRDRSVGQPGRMSA